MCQNKVIQYVEQEGFKLKEIVMRCGEIDQDGKLLMCDNCMSEAKKSYSQGWRDFPGDTCKHGNYVGGAYGPDYICGLCEDGE